MIIFCAFIRFCVGDRFFLCDNKILCEYDYEERMVFANLAYNQSNLAHIKQQAARSVAGKVSLILFLCYNTIVSKYNLLRPALKGISKH